MNVIDLANKRLGINFFGIQTRRFDLDPTNILEQKPLRRDTARILFIGVFVAIWFGFPYLVSAWTLSSQDGNYHFNITSQLWPSALVIIIALTACIRQIFYPVIIRVREKSIKVERLGLLARKSHILPFQQFVAVLMREQEIGTRRSGIEKYQVIELLHRDPRLSIPLLVRAGTSSLRSELETYGKKLNLPVVEKFGENVSVREASEIDQSVKERLDYGNLRN